VTPRRDEAPAMKPVVRAGLALALAAAVAAPARARAQEAGSVGGAPKPKMKFSGTELAKPSAKSVWSSSVMFTRPLGFQLR